MTQFPFIVDAHLDLAYNMTRGLEPPARGSPGTPGLATILLLEGADAIRSPDEVDEWFDAGIRIVGLAWRRTRHAGGTGAPGPLTAEGRSLVKELDCVGIIHDAS